LWFTLLKKAGFWQKSLHLHGWQLQRIRGSHHIYTHSGRPEILTAPVHGNQDSIAV